MNYTLFITLNKKIANRTSP